MSKKSTRNRIFLKNVMLAKIKSDQISTDGNCVRLLLKIIKSRMSFIKKFQINAIGCQAKFGSRTVNICLIRMSGEVLRCKN